MRSLGSPHPLKTEKGGAASGSMKGGPARRGVPTGARDANGCLILRPLLPKLWVNVGSQREGDLKGHDFSRADTRPIPFVIPSEAG